jgi:hypothetical protein
MNGAMKPLDEELQEAAEELKKKQKEDLKQLKHLDLSSFQVPAKIVYIVMTRTGRVAKILFGTTYPNGE